MPLVEQLTRGAPLALVSSADGVGLAWDGGSAALPGRPADLVRELTAAEPRWTWWTARAAARPLVADGLHVRTCWDLGAAGRLLHGLGRDDPAAVWAAEHGLPLPEPPRGEPDLFSTADAPLDPDGQLATAWPWATDLDAARQWAELAQRLQAAQESRLRALADPRPGADGPPLAVLTAYAESAAALLAVELEHSGLPVDRAEAAALLTDLLGPPPPDEADAAAQRRARDEAVLQLFPGSPVDLRNPASVRELLGRIGIDVPDTRSWRLEPYAASSPAVAALLGWRKAERVETTYGWRWLARHVGGDGRLRGSWGSADAAAGRMTASAGLHNLPADLRSAVRAEAGHVLVRADLGQVEPRVLATVSGDPELAAAAGEADLYAPVAAALRCERATAKVAVLAAMYGQTSGTAGAALRDLDRAYPQAMAYLRRAEEAGRAAQDLRTYGGRLLPLSRTSGGHGIGRFARNAMVQGAAAELFKAWAATVRGGLPALGGEVVLCLHDELLLHVPAEGAADAEALVRSALARTASWWAAGSSVRFVVDVSVGLSWTEAH